MAADQQSIATPALEILLDAIGHGLEVLQSFVRLLALGVSRVIAVPAVTLTAPGEFIDEVLLLHHFVVHQFEDARLGAVDQHHASMLHAVQYRGQRLQMKALVYEKVGLEPVSYTHLRAHET